MRTLKINGIEIEVSEKAYKSYLEQLKAQQQLEKNARKLNSPTKSVSPTYSDYVTRALSKGAKLLYLSDFVSVVVKGDIAIAEITAPIKKVYCGIKMSLTKDFGAKWCGDFDKHVFTYKFEDIKQAEKFVKAQKSRG